jgi:glutamate synthase (NADPH/NADH) small chain
MPKPPEKENKSLTWPNWPNKLRTSSSHEEGCERMWSVDTVSLEGENGQLTKINCVKVEWTHEAGRWVMNKVPGSEFSIETDLVLLAMGFVNPINEGMLEELGVERDERKNVKADTVSYRTSVDKVFTAGDMRRGQSLVVWAIREGRQCARSVDEFLMGSSELPR